MEIFKAKTSKEAFAILGYIVNHKYRGHDLCPCGCGEKLRNCHGNVVRFWTRKKYKEVLVQDFKLILKEVRGGRNA